MANIGSNSLKVARYALMPQFLPRLAALFFSGFDYFAYFMAMVYRGVRLLPDGHPFLNPQEIGNFSIPDVIAAAGRNLVYRRQNIDQILIFYVILVGLFLLVMQAAFMAIGIFSSQAVALSFGYYFGQDYQPFEGMELGQDLAFILLDRVFGIPGIFDSCVSLVDLECYRSSPTLAYSSEAVYKPADFPWPFHLALQSMFAFYSTGLLVVALFILLYFVVVIVAETAQTGVPFGRRFNRVWAPLRLVMAFGLLIPITNGINTAQYITLYAAKLGSNFATNGWLIFNSELTNGMMTSNVVAKPRNPEVADLLQFMMLAHACKAAEEGYNAPYDYDMPTDPDCGLSDELQRKTQVNAFLVKVTGNSSTDSRLLQYTNYTEAVDFFGHQDMTIRFGDLGCQKDHKNNSGHVFPVCGELTLSNATISDTEAGAQAIQEGYYELIRYLWGSYENSGGGTTRTWEYWGFCKEGDNYNEMMAGAGDEDIRKKALFHLQMKCPNDKVDMTDTDFFEEPTNDWVMGTYNNYMVGLYDTDYPDQVSPDGDYSPTVASAIIENIIRKGLEVERDSIANGKYQIPMEHLARGWAGAGMWYNQIARTNGAISGAAWEFPRIKRYPYLMETVLQAKLRNSENVSPDQLFTPEKSQDSSLQLNNASDMGAAAALQDVYGTWSKLSSTVKPKTGNPIYDFLNMLFGTKGLFDMSDPANQNVHPLALMTALGKGLVEASIRNVVMAMLGQGAQVLSAFAGNGVGKALGEAFSGALYSIATMTLTAGFILYYVLPFLPFVYFFFAVGNWVKGIFEAMVGVPLWALAHIRIDGDGLPGSAAINGYFLIFEIFIRPILILFGLLAAISIFAAMAAVFNAIFPVAVTNLGGLDYAKSSEADFLEFARGPVDQLFYTVMYAVVMYIMALSSFKLIDLIPNQILRWMGSNVSAFSEMAGDPAQNLTQYAAIGGSQITSGAIGGIQKMGQGGVSLAEGANAAMRSRHQAISGGK